VEEHQQQWPVSVMCEVLEVTRNGYYRWLRRQESVRKQREAELVKQMRVIHGERHRSCFGSPRMHQELVSRGHHVSVNTVARMMRVHGLRASTARKFRHTTDSRHPYPVAKNVLNQDFERTAADEAWAADITYVWTREGWLYLACVLDLYSRRVVGWSMSSRMTREVVIQALQMALAHRQPERGLLHHSDRGSQYASHEFQALLAARGIVCSMSRRGNCYDNAVMESFFATLKKELIYQVEYATRAAARQSIFEYVEVFYNRQRRHSSLGGVSPEAYEQQPRGTCAAAPRSCCASEFLEEGVDKRMMEHVVEEGGNGTATREIAVPGTILPSTAAGPLSGCSPAEPDSVSAGVEECRLSVSLAPAASELMSVEPLSTEYP
jgi:putative transposase